MSEIRASEMNEVLSKYLTPGTSLAISPDDQKKFTELVFAQDLALRDLLQDSEAKAVLEAFSITTLLARNARGDLLTKFRGAGHSGALQQDKTFWALWYTLQALMLTQKAVVDLLIGPKVAAHEGKAAVTLEVEDYDNSGVPAERLIDVLQQLTVLYESIEGALRVEHVAPVIAWIDSGTNFNISFSGGGEVIDAIGRMFGDMWRAIRNAKNDRIERDLETAAKGLTFLTTLKGGVAAGTIDPETGRILEHRIEESILALLGDGVMVSDVDTVVEYDRNAILTAVRDRKLLGKGDAPRVDGAAEGK